MNDIYVVHLRYATTCGDADSTEFFTHPVDATSRFEHIALNPRTLCGDPVSLSLYTVEFSNGQGVPVYTGPDAIYKCIESVDGDEWDDDVDVDVDVDVDGEEAEEDSE